MGHPDGGGLRLCCGGGGEACARLGVATQSTAPDIGPGGGLAGVGGATGWSGRQRRKESLGGGLGEGLGGRVWKQRQTHKPKPRPVRPGRQSGDEKVRRVCFRHRPGGDKCGKSVEKVWKSHEKCGKSVEKVRFVKRVARGFVSVTEPSGALTRRFASVGKLKEGLPRPVHPAVLLEGDKCGKV